jgi:ribonuclease-3
MPRDAALKRLERTLHRKFKNTALLDEALRHSSAAHERSVASYERLEFLGDAALSHAVAAMLFERWPEASEGELTRARSVIVRERALVAMAESVGLGDALELGGSLRAGETGPALLADAFEAILGALLLDAGWRVFERTIRRLVEPIVEGMDRSALALEEPKSLLQELAQKKGLPLPAYRETGVSGPAHARVYEYEVEFDGRVLGRGGGSSKRTAQQTAALRALELLGVAVLAPKPEPPQDEPAFGASRTEDG